MGALAASSALFAAYTAALLAGLAMALLTNQRAKATRTVKVSVRVMQSRSAAPSGRSTS